MSIVDQSWAQAIFKILGIEANVQLVNDLEHARNQWLTLKKIKDLVEDKQKELRKRIFDLVEKGGVQNENGSYVYQPEAGGVVEKQIRRKRTLNQDRAVALMKAKNLDRLVKPSYSASPDVQEAALAAYARKHKDLVRVGEVIDEQLTEQAVINGEITLDEFESIFDVKETEALRVE